MQNKQQLKQTYIKDVDLASSKSKFGFFSMAPSAFSAEEMFLPKTFEREENGKPKTQSRNIFSGLCATGVLKKTYFSYPQYKTDLYKDPGKVDRLKALKQNEKYKDKQSFRPASLNKTIATSSYEYISKKQPTRDPRLHRTEDGKVKTQNPNILSSPPSKLNYKSQNQLKYVSDPYENSKLIRRKELFQDISKRAQNAFKPSSPVKQLFSTNKQAFGQIPQLPKQKKQQIITVHQHDATFVPAGSHFNDGQFSYPRYMPVSECQNDSKVLQKTKEEDKQKKEPFKLIKQERNSRPCPSITLSKMNLIRAMRG